MIRHIYRLAVVTAAATIATSAFVVSSASASDTTPPRITESSVSATRVDLASNDLTITATIKTDEQPTQTPILGVWSETTSQSASTSGFVGQMTWVASGGYWQESATFNPEGATGAWDVVIFPLSDSLGNEGFFTTIGTINAVVCPCEPAQPTDVSSQAGNGSATVSWSAPSNTRAYGTADTYTVTASPGGASVTVPGTATSATLSGLTNGTNYNLTVVGHNSVGGSTPIGSSATPVGPPARPSAPTAVAGDRQATVSWAAPTNGGSAITGYTVTAEPGDQSVAVPAGQTSTTLTGLSNGTAYTFQVVASNANGDSAASAASTAVTPAGLPSMTGDVEATAGDRNATIAWQPATPNGAAISGYTITAQPGGHSVTVGGSLTSTVISGLTDGTAYTFAVSATNRVGSSASITSQAVTPVGVPTLSGVPSATISDTQATVTWSAASANGSQVSSYTVTATPGGQSITVAGTATSATISGLTKGSSYAFQVVATNALGDSSPITSAMTSEKAPVASAPTSHQSATKASAPSRPKAKAKVKGRRVTVTWSTPATNGSAITSYVVKVGSITKTVTASKHKLIVKVKKHGKVKITVTAVSQAGSSVPSAAIKVRLK